MAISRWIPAIQQELGKVIQNPRWMVYSRHNQTRLDLLGCNPFPCKQRLADCGILSRSLLKLTGEDGVVYVGAESI
jgi:hypothetical protein